MNLRRGRTEGVEEVRRQRTRREDRFPIIGCANALIFHHVWPAARIDAQEGDGRRRQGIDNKGCVCICVVIRSPDLRIRERNITRSKTRRSPPSLSACALFCVRVYWCVTRTLSVCPGGRASNFCSAVAGQWCRRNLVLACIWEVNARFPKDADWVVQYTYLLIVLAETTCI